MSALFFTLGGCSHNQLVVRLSDGILAEGAVLFDAEDDLTLVEQALPANIKLMEVMLRSDPGNEILQENLAKAYFALGFAVWEEKYLDHQAAAEPSELATRQTVAQATRYYDRSQGYARDYLAARDPRWSQYLTLGDTEMKELLGGLRGDDHVFLFWLTFSLGQKIQLLQSDMQWVAKLPRALMMMEPILAWNEGYYFGSPQLFMAVYYASRPQMLGGDLKKAEHHFAQARRLSQGKSKMVDVFEAQFLATQKLDRTAFDRALAKVMAPSDAPEALALLNAVAERKATRLLVQADELF